MANKPSPVALQVFAVPELLENIFNLVDDPIKLFVLQGVCKTFQALIVSSTTLRRRMCLEPDLSLMKLNDFFEDKRVIAVTAPFHFKRLSPEHHDWIDRQITGDESENREAIDMILSCHTLYHHRKSTVDGSVHEARRAVKKGSWQSIRVDIDMVRSHGILSCDNNYWTPTDSPLEPHATLTDLVNKAVVTLCTGWESRNEHCLDEDHTTYR